MITRIFLFMAATLAPAAYGWTEFKTDNKSEIRELLRHHRDLLDDYLIHAAETPGTKMTEARVRYITIRAESGGEKVYTCEVQTELQLSDGTQLSDKVEVEKLCDHVFKTR